MTCTRAKPPAPRARRRSPARSRRRRPARSRTCPAAIEYFTVAAVTAAGTSLPSSEVSYTYLTPPTTVTAEAISNTSVAISWSAVGGASTYSAYEGTAAGGESSSAVSCQALTPTSCLVSGLSQGDAYYFTVSADRGSFVSVPSTAEASATPGSQSAWAVPAAQERVAVTLDAQSITSVLDDFPVQVQLPASFDYGKAERSSLVFTRGADPTPLSYDVENWNPGGVSTIWVKVPTLAPADPPLYMYYDGAPANSTAATEVWGPDYLGVYHFGDAAGSTTVADSAEHGNDGTITYGTGGSGEVAFGQEGEDGSPSMTEASTNKADVSFGTLGEGIEQFTYSTTVGIDSTDAGLGELVLAGRNASGNTQPGEQFSLLTENRQLGADDRVGHRPDGRLDLHLPGRQALRDAAHLRLAGHLPGGRLDVLRPDDDLRRHRHAALRRRLRSLRRAVQRAARAGEPPVHDRHGDPGRDEARRRPVGRLELGRNAPRGRGPLERLGRRPAPGRRGRAREHRVAAGRLQDDRRVHRRQRTDRQHADRRHQRVLAGGDRLRLPVVRQRRPDRGRDRADAAP